MMESLWQQLAQTRKERALSWSDRAHVHVWWLSLWKWAADGPRKPRSLCGCWRGRGRDLNHDSCDVAWNKHGDSVGTESFHAPQQDRLLLRCWVLRGGQVLPSHEVERAQAVALSE